MISEKENIIITFMLKWNDKITIFTKKTMFKKSLYLYIILITVISCKKENSSTAIITSRGIVVSLKGLDLFSTTDLSSNKKYHLDYASKVKIISFDKTKNISTILYENQELYASLNSIELISPVEYDKSYFTKDCYCLLGLDRTKTINFPTKYDTVHFYTKDGKIRLIKEITCYKPSYETYIKHDVEISREDYDSETPDLYSYFTIDNNVFFIGNLFKEGSKSYLECYNKKSTYEVSKDFSKLSEYYEPKEFNYAMNLFNIDLLFAKADTDSFVKPLPNFDYKKEEIYIEQGDLNLEKATNIKLYNVDNLEPVDYKDFAIVFNYLREFKIIKKGGKEKCFVKINVLGNGISPFLGEYYIDLKEIAMFASIPD